MRIKSKWVIVLILFSALVFAKISVSAAEAPNGYDLVAENDNLILYADMETGNFAFTDKNTEKTWYSCPPDIENDEIASKAYKSLMQSPVILRCVMNSSLVNMKRSENIKPMDSMRDSVNKDSMTSELIENGVRFDFGFERYGFNVPVQYVLEEDYVRAEVLFYDKKSKFVGEDIVKVANDWTGETSEISYPMIITDFDFLTYFGAGGIDDKGYLFIPDGSGAIINFNNNKHRFGVYSQNVYGYDLTPKSISPPYEDKDYIYMPVFGGKVNEDAYLAVIHENASLAKISAYVSGSLTSYNYVYSSIEIYQVSSDRWYQGTGNNHVSPFRIEEGGTYEVRYYPLAKEDADYVGMAKRYRKYLVDEKGLEKNGAEGIFRLSLFGAVENQKYFLGVPYTGIEVLTSYKDCITIIEEMKESGIDDISLQYYGWQKGGIFGKVTTKPKTEGNLGGNGDYKKLAKFLKDNDIKYYPAVDFNNMYKTGNGFSTLIDGTRNNGGDPAYLNDDPESMERDRYSLVDPKKVSNAVDKFVNNFNKARSDGVTLEYMGSNLYSNFNKRNGSTRGETEVLWIENMKELKQVSSGGLLVEMAMAYAIPYADMITDMPVTSSGFYISDESVPFYQIVLRGYVPYSVPSINLSSDPHKMFLKAIEYGAGLQFSWIKRDMSLIMGTKMDFLYGGDYKMWMETASDYYNEAKEVFNKIGNSEIVGHHKLSDKIFETTFENGVVVVVNYSSKDYKYKGKTAESKNYIVVD